MENNINNSNGIDSSLFNSEIFHFLNAIEDFILKKAHTNWLADIYKMGINVYKSLPGTKFISIYILSDDDFLFEHRFSTPPEFESQSTLLYDVLINEGFIGQALEDSINVFFSIEDKHEFSGKGVVITLSVSTRILGLIVIRTDYPEIFENPIINKLSSLFAALLATYIENLNILRSLENTQSLLEQKIAQRTLDLTQSQRELKIILDSVLAGILVYEEHSKKILRVNPIAQSLIALEEDEIIGRNFRDFLEEVTFNEAEKNIAQSKFSFESKLLSSKKVFIPVIRTTTRLFLSNKNVIIESFVDVTEIKKFEEALKESNITLEAKVKSRTDDLQLLIHKLKIEVAERERAERELKRLYDKEKELNELKSKFVNLVSHEFRTPLTIIKSSTQMFQKFGLKLNSDEKEFYYARIIKTVDYLNDLIENSLFIGKNEDNNINLNLSKIDIESFIGNIVYDFLNSLDYHRVIEIISPKGLNINSDERVLYLVINNLLTNAHKYSHNDTKIMIECCQIEQFTSIKVIDNGIGIPKEEQMKIFDHFYRAKNVANVVGTGLGLAVVKESIEKLNGTVHLESEVGTGSTFEIRLPIN